MHVRIEVHCQERPRVKEIRELLRLDGNWKAVFTDGKGNVMGFPSQKRRPREGEVMTFVLEE